MKSQHQPQYRLRLHEPEAKSEHQFSTIEKHSKPIPYFSYSKLIFKTLGQRNLPQFKRGAPYGIEGVMKRESDDGNEIYIPITYIYRRLLIIQP
jgi:hypothetical protein